MKLSRDDRFILELVADIAGEAASNTNVVWTIEFQEALIDSLYRKFRELVAGEKDKDEDEEEEDEGEEESLEQTKRKPSPRPAPTRR